MNVAEGIAAAAVVVIPLTSSYLYRRDHDAADYADGSRDRMASPRSFAWVYLYIRITTLAIGLASLLVPSPYWLVLFRSETTCYAGLALAVLGFGMFVAARRALGRHYSPCYDSHTPHAIVQSGLYARIRHPIYTANLCLVMGLFVMTGSAWLGVNVLLLAGYYFRSARDEEAHLTSNHEEYLNYLRQTSRFVPRPGRRVTAP